jgi:hypothetical protein
MLLIFSQQQNSYALSQVAIDYREQMLNAQLSEISGKGPARFTAEDHSLIRIFTVHQVDSTRLMLSFYRSVRPLLNCGRCPPPRA